MFFKHSLNVLPQAHHAALRLLIEYKIMASFSNETGPSVSVLVFSGLSYSMDQ